MSSLILLFRYKIDKFRIFLIKIIAHEITEVVQEVETTLSSGDFDGVRIAPHGLLPIMKPGQPQPDAVQPGGAASMLGMCTTLSASANT